MCLEELHYTHITTIVFYTHVCSGAYMYRTSNKLVIHIINEKEKRAIETQVFVLPLLRAACLRMVGQGKVGLNQSAEDLELFPASVGKTVRKAVFKCSTKMLL